MAGFLKGLAILAGTGLGASAVLARPPRRSVVSRLEPEPVIERLDRMEVRLDTVEHPDPKPAIAEFDRRLQSQETEIHSLRVDVTETGRRITAQMDYVERRFREVSEEIPVVVEASLNARIGEMQARLESEIDARHKDSLITFEKAIDKKVTERISALERTLLDQSVSIGALRERAEATDQNLQRLIGAIERLGERTQLEPLEFAARPPVPSDSFTAQLNEAMRGSNGPVQIPREMRPKFVPEFVPEEKKPRVPMARIFVALLAVGISRFLR